ncbi:hypothetical protein MNBD_GAMMA22-2320 [hydrothermal vent metagenome]|uniref:Uncharacterized protein n=1 Tax=hydrothermal vent metagenome TaxID=652676 RepID=A0A3B0ZXE5_9ZZZZ
MKNHNFTSQKAFLIFSLSASFSLLTACGGGQQDSDATSPVANTAPVLELNLPNSLTGGVQNTSALTVKQPAQVVGSASDAQIITNAVSAAANASNQPCAFIGVSDNDPFRNGYQMTKLLVSSVAAWTCIGDTLINLSNFIAHDGVILETDNDTTASNYDPQEPTHYSITDDSEAQTTIRIYYRYSRATPPRVDDDPQFYISWNESSTDSAVIEGRLIIDAVKIQDSARKADDPIKLRMDFNYTPTTKDVDVFLQFDNGNEWAEGFRINVSKDLTANPLTQVYLARGLIKMKKQFLPVTGISEIPSVQIFTVSDNLGKGAAIAEFQDISLPLELNASTNNHLGNYLFTKTDNYYFKANQESEWIQKSITTSEYRGSRTTPSTGGSFPADPSLDNLISALNLDSNYFTGTMCASVGDDCNALLNSIFQEGLFSHEQNQGIDPMDWRTTALATPSYLNSIYPNGADWFGAFDYSFTPSLN